MVAKIYVEGAAQNSYRARTLCRKSFATFFANTDLKNKLKLPGIVPCGGRKRTYDNFKTAMKTRQPDELPLLLVDSETAVKTGRTAWEHLKERPEDNWDKPEGAKDDQAFLMVQVMETWFLADREALKSFFGQHLRDTAFKKWPHLEDVPKATVIETLKTATAACAKKYEKGETSFDLLANISPKEVEDASPHAKALFERLRNL